MIHSLRYSKFFGVMGGGLILGGMFLQNVYEYAPTIGWLGGIVSLIVAAIIANQSKNKNITTN